jgi:hypothetical protein
MRSNGLSHIRAATCFEFFTGVLRFKFGGASTQWRRSHPPVVIHSAAEQSAMYEKAAI